MNIFDKLISSISAERGLKRAINRTQIRIIENSGYSQHGASTRKNSMKGWSTTSGDPDSDITENLPLLRERSRDSFMGGGLATGAIKTMRTNVVGSGLKMTPVIDYEFLGMTIEQAAEWKRKTLREWALWSDSVACDSAAKMTFGQIQSLAVISSLMNGDCFVLMQSKKRVNDPFLLRVKLIESDYVTDPSAKNGKDISGGIELDSDGETVAAWISKKHPAGALYIAPSDIVRVPFFGSSGRRNVLHVAQDWERIGQRRGVPFLTPVLGLLKQLSRYQDAELMASLVSSMFTVFIKSNSPSDPLQSSLNQYDTPAGLSENDYALGNASVVALSDGEEAQVANPARQNTSFSSFCTELARYIGVALEIPYEILLKHFTSSFSASRGALLEAWKLFRMRRKWLVQSFCQPIYEEWLTDAVLSGRISAPGFFSDPAIKAAWCSADWFGPSQGHLNPLQEANAAKTRIEAGISTHERETAEFTGEDWNNTINQLAREENKMKELGVTSEEQTLVTDQKFDE